MRHLDRAAHGIDDAGKLDQQPVAGGLHNAAAVLCDPRIAQFAPDRPQYGKRALFVSLH
jgi:hypothetical protein